MSWELDNVQYKECPCGKGRIRVESYSDDWNRFDTRYEIECEYCKDHYHIERSPSYKPYRGSSTFLVKNGETTSFQAQEHSFEEYLVYTYSEDELNAIYAQLLIVTSAQKADKQIIQKHRRWYHTVKISTIRQHISDAIEKYHSFEYNKEIISVKKAECDKVERFYI